MPVPDAPNTPKLDTDPRNRQELDHWRERHAKMFPGEPLTPREYLMVKGLQNKRKAYSET
jgi:hypothetical protein